MQESSHDYNPLTASKHIMAKRGRNSSTTANTESLPEETSAHTPKYMELEEPLQDTQPSMQCSLPPHKPLTFMSYIEYEHHYHQSHSNRCRECRRNFPSPNFLDLHLAENHDPIIATKREQGEKTYACFVEGCDKVCVDWKKRRNHLVDKHCYPKNYDFFVVNSGTDGKRSMLRPGVDAQGHRKSSRERRGSSATESTQTTDATSVDVSMPVDVPIQEENEAATNDSPAAKRAPPKSVSMDEVTQSMSSLQFVPRSVTFGKRKGKSGFATS